MGGVFSEVRGVLTLLKGEIGVNDCEDERFASVTGGGEGGITRNCKRLSCGFAGTKLNRQRPQVLSALTASAPFLLRPTFASETRPFAKTIIPSSRVGPSPLLTVSTPVPRLS